MYRQTAVTSRQQRMTHGQSWLPWNSQTVWWVPCYQPSHHIFSMWLSIFTYPTTVPGMEISCQNYNTVRNNLANVKWFHFNSITTQSQYFPQKLFKVNSQLLSRRRLPPLSCKQWNSTSRYLSTLGSWQLEQPQTLPWWATFIVFDVRYQSHISEMRVHSIELCIWALQLHTSAVWTLNPLL